MSTGGAGREEWAGLAYPKFLEFLVRSRLGYTRKKCKVGVGKAVCIIDSCCGIIRFKTTPFCRGFVSCLNDRSLSVSFTLSISISLCLCPRLTPEMLLLSLGCQPHFVRLCSALCFCARRLLSRCLVVLATHTP